MARRKNLAGQLLGWLIIPVIVGGSATYVLLREPEVEVTAVALSKGRVEKTVAAIASGTVMAEQDATIASEVMGMVLAIHADEGDRVEEGDLLIELNHTELDAHVALAKANLSVGLSRLEQARLAAKIFEEVAATRVSQTAARLDQARSDFERVKALSERNAISESDFDKAAVALRVAQEDHDAAVANQRENLVRQEEIRSAQATIKQLEASLAVAQAMREKAFIRAPFSGVVARVVADAGEAVTVGLPIGQLVQTADSYIEAPFDEANAAEIAVGQKVRINLDAYRGVDFWGRVSFISPIVSINRDLSRTLNVRISLEEGQEEFVPGMSADVTLLVNEKDDALFVPSEALIREKYAYIVENGRAVRREVQTGIGNWYRREVLGGLRLGEALITSVSLKELHDGVRVRVVDELVER